MTDLEQELAEARSHVAPSWSKERERAVRADIDRAQAAERTRRSVARTAALVVSVACAAFFWVHGRPGGAPAERPVAAAAPSAALLHLDDGSTVTARSADARVEPVAVGPQAVVVRLTAGTALFTVTPNPGRAFRVQAGNVTVTVVGTVFQVGLTPGGVRVVVERGRVRVAWPSAERELGAGEEVVVDERAVPPPLPPAASAGALEPSASLGDGNPHQPAGDVPSRAAASAPATPAASWRTLAEDGEFARAYARLTAEGSSAVRDEPGDLLLAADVARLGGHPEQAVAHLERVIATHSSDSRAPLAAFTLGRTLLDQLGRPREAAEAFATARRLDPRGALSQDALAREVEGWSRAGEAGIARERAEEYGARYPKGRRLSVVRRLGGLD